jgi:hypothetical protein
MSFRTSKGRLLMIRRIGSHSLGVFLLGITAFLGLAWPARGHFLFIRITPPAEAGRAAEVYFSDQAEAGDPRFVAKIGHTQLWSQSTPGKFQPLEVRKAADRLRAHLPSSGSLSVIGACEYGVLARPKKVPFLLRHYPRAVAGTPAELNRLKPCDKVPLEIAAVFEGDQVTLTALHHGKPVPRAVFHTVDSNLFGDKLTAGADGKLVWKPAGADRYAVYTSQVTKASGTAGGKPYEEVRDFATLAFAWPLAGKGPDAKAVALFEEALAARAQWKDFPGFSARITGKVDGRAFQGSVTVSAAGAVELKTNDEAVRPWVKDQLESIALHRGAGSRGEAANQRAKPVLRFADAEDDHPLGRLLLFDGGRFASSYRVKDRQIVVVNRNMGRVNMTITVLDNEKNREGRFLPRSYVVQFWDAATGALRNSETVQDRWTRVGDWDLPASHVVTSASGAGLAIRSFRLSGHQLLKSK